MKPKITLRLEKDGRYIQRILSERMICALFDLQFMIDGNLPLVNFELDGLAKKHKKNKKLVSLIKQVKKINNSMNTWNTLEINDMSKEIHEFFRLIELFDDSMHGNQIGYFDDKTKKMVWRKKKKGEYIFGKPNWKKIK